MRVSLGLLFLFSGLVFGQADHLVFSEVVLTPSDGEYVQITNPTADDIDMSDYYLTDATDGSGNAYYNLPSGSGFWSGSGFDFICFCAQYYEITKRLLLQDVPETPNCMNKDLFYHIHQNISSGT